MIGEERWQSNSLAVSPAGAVAVDLPRLAFKRRGLQRAVRDLPTGTPVVLSASVPGAIGRCRRFSSKAGIELEREYLAFPSAKAPGYLVEDAPAAVGVLPMLAVKVPTTDAVARVRAAPVQDRGLRRVIATISGVWRPERREPVASVVGFRGR